MVALLLGLSIVLSAGRNILSKNLSDVKFGTGAFFRCQSVLFLCGGAALVLFGKIQWNALAPQTLLFAAIYGALLIFAQWFYTSALSSGNVALCSTVYSMGFILPTLSGAIFFSEPLSMLDILGILCAASAVVVSGMSKKSERTDKKTNYIFPLIVAMIASGGLGIVQKVQQHSEYAEQKSIFLLIAFIIAAAVSFAFSLGTRKTEQTAGKKHILFAACVGLFFGCCNLLNTSLAGMMDSAIFFPTLNIGTILLSMLLGVLLFKEKLRAKEISVLSLGAAAILLLNINI